MSWSLSIHVRRIIAVLLLLFDLAQEPGSALSLAGFGDTDGDAVAELCTKDDFWWGTATACVGGAGVIWGFVEGQNERAVEAAREAPVKAPLRVSTQGGETTITLNKQAQQNSEILTIQLQSTANQAQVQAYGTVLDLQPRTEQQLHNDEGSAPNRQAKRNASRTAFERAQRLYQDQQNLSAAQLQTAESNFRVDEANVAAAEAQLQNVTSSALQQWGTVLGRALVGRAPMLLRLLQRQDMLVQVTWPPGESLAEPPRTAVAQSDNGIRANIQFVSPASRTDARIQGVSFYYTVSADSGLLPGMNVVVMLPSGRAANGSFIPASAIVWSQGKAWAYYRTGGRLLRAGKS